MATRKENFWAYYKANPSKLGGKTIDEAYNAMRREASRKDLSKGKDPLMQRVATRGGSSGNKGVPDSIKRAVARRTATGKKPTGPGSPYKRWSESGFQVGPKKGTVWGNHVASQKPGAKALWFDDLLGNKSRKAKYADNERIAKNKKAPKKSAIERRVSGV